MLNSSNLKSIGIDVANEHLDKIGAGMGVHKILGTCDRSGITQDGYACLYKQFKGSAKATKKGLKVNCLPKPYCLSSTKTNELEVV